jgi:hypothetical protein
MTAPASLSSPTAAPTGFEAVRETLSNLLLLLIIGMLTAGVERLIASLRQRTETIDLTDVTRAFGTTDIALILERLTTGLQRLRALEDKIRRSVAGLDTGPQPDSTGAASSPLSLCAPQPLGLAPEDVSLLALLTSEPIVAAPVRATGPPRPPWLGLQTPTGPVHPLTPRGMAGPVVPIPHLQRKAASVRGSNAYQRSNLALVRAIRSRSQP